VRAQQPAKRPVIGLLSSVSFEAYAVRVDAFRQGLKDTGFVEGNNVTLEYRSADGRVERLPSLAIELVRQQVDVIITVGGDAPVYAAKAATSTIPIVFASGADAIDSGFVISVSRPEANITGVSFAPPFSSELNPKRLELLRDLFPGARLFGFLVGPVANPERFIDAFVLAAQNMGLRGVASRADTGEEIDKAFTTFVQQGIAAVVIQNDAFLNSRRDQIVALAARHAIPAIYAYREHIIAGGLMSYGTNVNEMYRQAGIYTGRILQGARPGDLPVMTPTKFELLINLKTAKTLGLTIPQSILLRADEVIE
jgi:putative ABC transport system substrate-binding protein